MPNVGIYGGDVVENVDDGDVVQSFAESSGQRKMPVDSRLNSDEGGVTSSDCEGKSRSKSAVSRTMRQRRTVDVVDADLISYRPVLGPRSSADPDQSESARPGDVPPGVEVEATRAADAVEQRPRRREHDVKELRRRLKWQRAHRTRDDEQTQSSPDRDTVETRLDQLARFTIKQHSLLVFNRASHNSLDCCRRIIVYRLFPDCLHGS